MKQRQSSGQQRRIGLTGGIATGKSSVGQLLVERGLPVLDADAYARAALAPDSGAAASVLERYGPSVLAATSDSKDPPLLDRAALGRIVFADPAERHWLEQLVHPIVRTRMEADLLDQAVEPTVVVMVPLLFEAGLEDLCSEVWLVDCDEHQQLQRLMQRDGLSDSEALCRIGAQWPLARKRLLATTVIDNRGLPEALPAQVEQALRQP
jgi:dephospho-CoA kinase